MQAKGFREQGTEENMWAQEGRGNRGVEKSTWQGALFSVLTKYHSGDQIKTEIGQFIQHVWVTGEIYVGFLMGRPKGRRLPGSPRRRGEDNIEMDLREVGWGHGLN